MSAEEPLVVRCATHPDMETGLRCGRCDTPICPRCLIMTPVGARCRACARLRSHPLYDVRPMQYLRGAAAGLAVGLVGGFILHSVPFIGFFGPLILGWATGEAVTYGANRKRGIGLAVIAAGATILGAVGPLLLLGSPLIAFASLFSLWGLFVGLAAVIAVSRVR
jgi:hypothetical protein